jgi:hypothetical protein
MLIAPPLLRPVATLGLLTAALPAVALDVPNHSFELPAGPFSPTGVSTSIEAWQKSPPPGWFDPNSFGVSWNSLSGIFPNAPSGDPRHITNADGGQVAYFFAVPQVAISQLLASTFSADVAYTLTVGLRGGGALTAGSSFMVGLFHLDGANPVTLATTPVTATADYATATAFTDITVDVPALSAGDAAVGKNIGIQLVVTSQNGAPGIAYWEADNVRLAAVPEPEEYALIAGAALLGGALWHRCRRQQ